MTKTRNISDLLDANGDVKSGALDNVTNAVAPTRHSIRPSLNLDFANSKVLDPRITFTRASNATYYDGYTSVKAEENLFSYSQEFDNAYWTKFRITLTADDTTAPDGTTTAEKVAQASGETTGGAVGKTLFTVVNGSYYTLSIFAKAGTNRNFVGLRDSVSGGSNTTWFNLSTGAVGTTSANHTASISDAGNGWYRCSITFLTTTTSGSLTYYVYETDNSTTVTDDQGFIYLWGSQLEQRDSLTAYTPTTTQPITKYQPALQTAGNNVARFDHNPTTGESLGLLIEESRTNLQVYSEEFNNVAWSKQRITITPNTIVAPDGTLTADKLFVTTDTGWHYIFDSNSVTSGNTYTISFYAKKAEQEYISAHFPSVEFGDTNVGNSCTFNLSTGVISNQGTYLLSASITDVGNGWYRCSLTKEATSTASADLIITLPNQSSFTTSGYTGDGYSGVYLWGVQLEQASFPTSYIPTVASQVTRSADGASMTGTNFSDWYRQDEGTLYVECKTNDQNTGFPGIFELDNQTVGAVSTSNRIALLGRPSGLINVQIARSSSEVNIQISSDFRNDFLKAVLAYRNNDVNLTTETTSGIDTDVVIPTVINFSIGEQNTGYLNGTIKKLAYYPLRLTNNELVDLTEE
jgi:hypothetical protein